LHWAPKVIFVSLVLLISNIGVKVFQLEKSVVV